MDSEGLSFRACQAVTIDSGANASVTATSSTPAANKRWGVTGWLISASGNVAAAVQASLVIGAQTIHFQIPAGQIPSSVGFVNLPRMLPGDIAQPISLTVPALGAAIVCTVTLFLVPLSA